jgi:hypothetical protein
MEEAATGPGDDNTTIAAATASAVPRVGDLLHALNQSGLDAYCTARQRFISQLDPLILVGRDLTFLFNGTERHESYTPDCYTILGTLSHPYLGVVVILEAFIDDPAEHQDTWRPHLRAIRRETQAVLPHLEAFGLDADTVRRNRFILDRLITFIERVLEQGTTTPGELAALGAELGPLLLANVSLAARAQIDRMKTIVDCWHAEVGPVAWSNVRVVVEGLHQPRVNNLQYLFFRYALGERASTHLIYAENVLDQKSAIELAGTVEVDRSLAAVTFNDPLRMQRDLLGDAADAYLQQIFGKLDRAVSGFGSAEDRRCRESEGLLPGRS